MPKPFYVTTPIYYVNDRPHIGHAYTTIAADVLTRFHRLAGREAFFLTGTDEHGSKVAEAAAAAGLSELEFCDKTVKYFESAWKNLSIENDYFIRTTSERHKKSVWKILDAMRKAKTPDGQDVVYTGFYEGLYCTGCEKFLTEKDLVNGLCPLHNRKPELVKEKNYFFRLSAYFPELKKRIESNELLILPDERRREVLGLIEQDIGDFSLSREKVKWGIPLSFDESQMAYVWVDALTNYITAIGYADDDKSFDKWWNKGETVHLMAKDILKFHCLYWPAMLMAAGEKLPNKIFLHGFFTIDGEKMSKTLGKKIDPNDMVDEFGADATRYLLLTQFPFGIDGDIKVARFTEQHNSDLANNLGNLVSRVVKLIEKNFDGKIPEYNFRLWLLMNGLLTKAERKQFVDRIYEHVNEFRIDKAISAIMNFVSETNKFVDEMAPWDLKPDSKKRLLENTLVICCERLRIISILISPILPSKALEIRKVLGIKRKKMSIDELKEEYQWIPGARISLSEPLFPRLLKVTFKISIEQGKKVKATADIPIEYGKKNNGDLLDISDFAKAKLKVAEVLKAEKVEGADKLLKLQIDLGSEQRQIVAGVAEFYSPEQMVGKRIIVVSNLKPAKIRGVESQGMLLAAKKGKQLAIVTPDGDLPPGSDVS